MKISQKYCLALGLALLFIGCGGGSSTEPVSNVQKKVSAQTVPTLRIKPQQNYTDSNGSFDVQKYQLTQTKYLNSK